MYSRISRRLLHCFAAELKSRSRPASAHTCNQVSSTIRRLHQSRDDANKFEFSECSSSESLHCDESPDVFMDEPDDTDESVDYEAITGNDPEKMEALRMVLRDIQVLRQRGYPYVPSRIASKKWESLMSCATFDERKSYLNYLYINEKKDMVARKRKIQLQQTFGERPKKPPVELMTNSPLEYGLGRNTLFHRTYNTHMKFYYNYRLALAEWFGPHLIIDCGYESYMTFKERHHCCRQLALSWCQNRFHVQPFDIIFCNVEKTSAVYESFRRLIPMDALESLVNFSSKHYMDLFPTEKLIYLSPHSDHVLEEYDGDAVYIIGAFVDELIHDPISMQRAERDGIRTAKFPIDKYLNWCQGSQFLPLNQCVEIMNRLHEGKSWEDALDCITRKKRNYVGLHFGKTPKVDLKSTRHLIAMQRYEMGRIPRERTPSDLS